MALERSLEGRDQLLKLVKRQARAIQERHRTGLQLGAPYTCHGSCLLSRSCDVRGVSYQKESGINSSVSEHIRHCIENTPLHVSPRMIMPPGKVHVYIGGGNDTPNDSQTKRAKLPKAAVKSACVYWMNSKP